MTSIPPACKLFLRLPRRRVLAGLAATFLGANARLARAENAFDADEDLRNLKTYDFSEAGRRVLVIAPKYMAKEQRLPLLVLLHGLGETVDERMGAYGWLERYGLGSAWQRLKRAPIERTSRRGEWTDGRLAEVNDELAVRPFRGFILACPFMPNPKGPADLDAYARWIERALLPRVRSEAPCDPAKTFLCGVSLGGYVSLEMLARMPGVFDAWGGVQTAIGPWAARNYADKIATMAKRPKCFLLTSSQDHWRASSEALHATLDAKGLAPTFRVTPGPHDQPWLRESGSIETLLWFDRLSYASL